MLMVYSSYNCSSCKKAMKWLNENGIMYEELNFLGTTLKEEDVINMLKYTENGFEDIISERSKVFMRYEERLKKMKIKDLIQFIIDNPSVLKRPIIVDPVTEEVIVGYREVDMEDLI